MGKRGPAPTAGEPRWKEGAGCGLLSSVLPETIFTPLGAVVSFFPAAAAGPGWAVGLAGVGHSRVCRSSAPHAHTARR